MTDNGHIKDDKALKAHSNSAHSDSFVLDKSIFSNIFDKDIKRVYIYKKVERLAKAIHLISPAFTQSPSLRDRMDRIAIGLVDAAILPPFAAREALSRELLALSSVLSIARTGNLLSSMNSDLILRESHQLLQEIAAYEEPRLSLDDAPTLAELAREATSVGRQDLGFERKTLVSNQPRATRPAARPEEGGAARSAVGTPRNTKGHVKDNLSVSFKSAVPGQPTTRQEAIISVLRAKGPTYIKDISTVIRDVSEKTIQRELGALVASGIVEKAGERRWTTYTLA